MYYNWFQVLCYVLCLSQRGHYITKHWPVNFVLSLKNLLLISPETWVICTLCNIQDTCHLSCCLAVHLSIESICFNQLPQYFFSPRNNLNAHFPVDMALTCSKIDSRLTHLASQNSISVIGPGFLPSSTSCWLSCEMISSTCVRWVCVKLSD